MTSPRWRKLIRDLWGYKTRSALVVLSITVGVFAIGMVAGARAILERDATASYMATNPASAALYTDAFGDDQIRVVRAMKQVAEASGVRRLNVRLKTGPNEWATLQLVAFADYENIRLNKVAPVRGDWPPPKNTMLVERASLAATKAQMGDDVTIEMPDGKQRAICISGLAYDIGKAPPSFSGVAYGYVTMDTLEWLGQPRAYNELDIVVAGNTLDREYIRQVGGQVRDKLEQSGLRVYSVSVPIPGKHPADSQVQALLLLLVAIGILSLFASGFLIVNTISAILAQQVRQIGIMKAIGGRTRQVAAIYIGMVVVYSLLALALAIPLATIGAHAIVHYIGGLLNMDIGSIELPPNVLALQIGVGLIVPLLAALLPIVRGTQVTVREALCDYGLRNPTRGLTDQVIDRIPRVSRSFLLSLRNTFRRKARLALTLLTLTLGGAIFISVMTVRSSLLLTLDGIFDFWSYDVEIDFSRAYRTEVIEQETRINPEVVSMENWTFAGVRRVRPNGTTSESLFLNGLPAPSDVIHPSLMAGRWLLPDDENAVVINADLLKNEPDVKIGDDLVLREGTEETHWQVVGLIRGSFSGPRLFANYAYASRVFHAAGRAEAALIVTRTHDAASQTRAAKALDEHFKHVGLRVSYVGTTEEIRQRADFQVGIIIGFLMLMALLLALVGGMGLMGTMGLNVVERTREVGVMRAIGASNRSVISIVIGEGVLIGVLSWMAGVVLSLPLGKLLSDAVGAAILNDHLNFTYSVDGAAIWLIFVVILAALASFLPARAASRLSVRQVLAYE